MYASIPSQTSHKHTRLTSKLEVSILAAASSSCSTMAATCTHSNMVGQRYIAAPATAFECIGRVQLLEQKVMITSGVPRNTTRFLPCVVLLLGELASPAAAALAALLCHKCLAATIGL